VYKWCPDCYVLSWHVFLCFYLHCASCGIFPFLFLTKKYWFETFFPNFVLESCEDLLRNFFSDIIGWHVTEKKEKENLSKSLCSLKPSVIGPYKKKKNTLSYSPTCLLLIRLVWPLPVAQVWTHYKIGKLNMWTLFCNLCIGFLNSQIWKEVMLELNGKPSSVTTSSTDFSFQKTRFFGIYLNFQQQKSLKNQYLQNSESKSYQINSINSSHQDISKNTKCTFQFLRNFQLRFNLIFSE
jgi:hypothetical protein